MHATYKTYTLDFKRPAGTSRGVMHSKDTWFLELTQDGKKGIGECGLLKGLSVDDVPSYEAKLQWVCDNINLGKAALLNELEEFPSLQMGVETAFMSCAANNPFVLFPSAFTKGEEGIVTNGLIWMGDKAFMQQQIKEKIAQGFRCIKLKIGAIDFATEYELLKGIRAEFSSADIELRVDANGAFTPDTALEKLKRLSDLQLHSIEQPIKAGQWDTMAQLCAQTPLPIALDEELIGVFGDDQKAKLLQTIQPQYIILKPSLVGGFLGSDSWIALAEKLDIGWWVTSALESNIGFNAIAQYTYTKNNTMPQGLGTGGLYTNNISSPLVLTGERLYYNQSHKWDLLKGLL